jgi:transcriptional regulator with XRE-family HTH domain
MDIIERLRKDCEGLKTVQVEALAVDMGVPPGTLLKIANGTTTSPRYDTVKAIQAYYDRLPVAPMALPIVADRAAT